MYRASLALVGVAALVAAIAVGVGSAGTSGPSKSGGTVVFGAEQEPPCLNFALSGCNNTWTAWTVGTQTRGLYIQNPDYSFTPDMAQSAKLVKSKPETIAVTIKKKADWSDGVPVTYQDFVYTWKHVRQPEERRRGPKRLRLDQVGREDEQGRQELQRRVREAVRAVAGPLHDGSLPVACPPGPGRLQQRLAHGYEQPEERPADLGRPLRHDELHEGPVDDVHAEPEVVGPAQAVPRQGRLRLPDEHRLRDPGDPRRRGGRDLPAAAAAAARPEGHGRAQDRRPRRGRAWSTSTSTSRRRAASRSCVLRGSGRRSPTRSTVRQW